jgi:hypothetical protein
MIVNLHLVYNSAMDIASTVAHTHILNVHTHSTSVAKHTSCITLTLSQVHTIHNNTHSYISMSLCCMRFSVAAYYLALALVL